MQHNITMMTTTMMNDEVNDDDESVFRYQNLTTVLVGL
jgi:hypothetical protein